MPHAIVVGGGLAGLATAAALAGSGFTVDVFESRGFLGGRATSFPLPPSEGTSEVVDNCQHVLLRCCVNLLDFYRRLGVEQEIRFYREFYFLEPGGRVSILRPGALPAPLHFAASFLRFACLDLGDRIAVARALLAIRKDRLRTDLDRITMLEWLRERRQTPRAIERFWRQILVSAVNEELDRMPALYGIQVFWLGFLSRSDASQMGVPVVPLAELYRPEVWSRFDGVRLRMRTPVERIEVADGQVHGVRAAGEQYRADYYVSSLPFERLPAVCPDLAVNADRLEHSPITGIHLWFDRPVTDLPHGTLLDRTIQWFFDKGQGRRIQVVVSASRSLLPMPRQDVIALVLGELAEFLPRVREARLEKAHVVKEVHATFSARPGIDALRPETRTRFPNLFLAGDWTRTGWPATMEGAVRSGYLAAEAVSDAAGLRLRFLLHDDSVVCKRG